jgi:hypothetical protein
VKTPLQEFHDGFGCGVIEILTKYAEQQPAGFEQQLLP